MPFLQDFAGCLGRTDQVDVPDSYQYLSEICDASKVPVKISRESFFEAAGVVDPDAGLDTEPKPDGISTGAQAGIAIGIIVAVAAALGGLICFFCRYKGRKIKTAVEVKSCSFQELSSSTTTLPRTLPTPAELSSPPLSTLPQPLPAELSALAPPPPEYTPSSASVDDSLQTQSQTVPPQTPLAWTYLESAMGPQTMAGHGSPLDEKTTPPGTQDRTPSYELEDTSPTTPEPAVQSEKRMEKV
ncbi:hypothetical protein DCS_05856 [Drechmeria coniospora]|uniref:Uncharacterized protein n=1 Tax=Drechmeria coniospora TaxID=98403 RepID=A0A151GP36_DRECN|nr:hypothetical protein DCS_05856 [Drechmeria coniospora]KYK58838.1 hypothetical protein DCS_05856 [Drechmeria coniospora]